jgi:hypothetical protein
MLKGRAGRPLAAMWSNRLANLLLDFVEFPETGGAHSGHGLAVACSAIGIRPPAGSGRCRQASKRMRREQRRSACPDRRHRFVTDKAR